MFDFERFFSPALSLARIVPLLLHVSTSNKKQVKVCLICFEMVYHKVFELLDTFD